MKPYDQASLDDASLAALEQAVPGGVSVRAADRLALAHDASHYLLTPRAVVTPSSEDQVAALLRAARSIGLPLTFRSGGTSLSGQAGSEHLLVDTRRHFRDIEVLDDGGRVTVAPGVTVRAVNARLAPHGTKLGPDPASEVACTIGGVIANNSSGMACGTEQNTYRTLASAVLVLPSGTLLDTSRADADEFLAHQEPQLFNGLIRLRDRVRSNPAAVATIRRLFAIKNTMGYGVNAFLDFDSPTQLLLHLVIGSEGTLAFVARATFHTVPLHPYRATGLLLFPNLHSATEALPDLVGSGPRAVELMDAASLRVAQRDPQADRTLRGLTVDRHAALLVEYQESSAADLDASVELGTSALTKPSLAGPVSLTTDAAARRALWHIRKGLYAAVAGSRPPGTTALLEDVAVPLESLAGACERLVGLFDAHGYRDSVIFGHAKDGNIHFLLNESFGGGAERYLAFTEDMVGLVLSAGGTLKAEHGTGRIMAPFVKRQYGEELYEVMVELKRLVDPAGILNPDTVLVTDDNAHVRDLKTSPVVEEEVDRCVECGYCEPVCPSRDLTLTPRTRIVLRREIARADARGDTALAGRLRADYEYEGVQTCAADGMCQTACPVMIDTGRLVKRLRAEQEGPVEARLWQAAARHWKASTRAAATALDAARRMPPALSETGSGIARRVAGAESVPLWTRDLPAAGRPRREVAAEPADLVFMPACVGSIFGADHGGGVAEAFLTLCRRAGLTVRTPRDVATLCCGTPWKSKGHQGGYDAMAARVVPRIWQASDHGRLPVVVDASSCTEGLADMMLDRAELPGRIEVVDAVRFAGSHLLSRLEPRRRLPSLTLHPTCSSTRLGLNEELVRLAEAIATEVHVPADWGCCGFAGDRGMLHPELTASAAAVEAAEVAGRPTSAYASLNRTCEIGMTRATGRTYRHVLELLLEVTS